MKNRLDLLGSQHGRLTVVRFSYIDRHRNALWECACQCGATVTTSATQLRQGKTRSCGCLRNEIAGGRTRTHGRSGSVEHGIWKGIIQRCTNPKRFSYKYYGGLGITICEEWRLSFPAFFAYVGQRPAPHLTIDRIDPYGNYEPGNVRWADKTTQRINRRAAA